MSCTLTLQYTVLCLTNGFCPRHAARALRAPVFLCSFTRKRSAKRHNPHRSFAVPLFNDIEKICEESSVPQTELKDLSYVKRNRKGIITRYSPFEEMTVIRIVQSLTIQYYSA